MFDLFSRRENTLDAQRERLNRVAKRTTGVLRNISNLLVRAADFIEKHRLEIDGYKAQGVFLERLEKKENRAENSNKESSV